MKKALVLGISGGFGGHIAEELARSGWQIRALLRNPVKYSQGAYAVELISGDAANINDVRQAAAGVDLIVYGINAPYPKWENLVVPMLNVMATVAEENKLIILFPGNVYPLNPQDGPEFDEATPFNPPTRKGELRSEMEARLKVAASRGARVIIIRAGDFIGAGAPSTWMKHLITATKTGYTLQAASDPRLVHTWSYLPDIARVAAKLIANAQDYANFNVFHFKGYRANFYDIAQAIENATGKPVKVKSFPWGALKLLQLFSPTMRSLVEMQYLWKCEINLSDKKLELYLGQPVHYTTLGKALLETGVLNRTVSSSEGESSKGGLKRV